MGKKVKKKARSGHKDKPVSTPSQRTVAQESTPSTETVDDGLLVMKERKVCSHLDKGGRVRAAVDRRTSKGRGKQGKRQGGGSIDAKSESKSIWICLECGHLSCGGVGFPTTPQSHAVRHARQTRHPLAIQFEHLQLRWCFPCNTLIPVERLEEDGEQKDLLSDLVKLIKGRSSQGASVNVEDAWFGNGSVASETKSVNTAASILDAKSGYVAKGLVNLGNTCFFNSIMQNLLAMDRLRDHFLELNESVGPLTVSLKKLFVETSSASGLKNVINPRSFFGCVCAKAPQFRGYLQHDSHELLRCLLDGLCTEELSARKRTTREIGISINLGPTFVDAVFGGQLSSTVSCLVCGHSSTVFETFLDLSLPVPTKKPPSKRAQPISRAKKPKLPPKRSGRVRPKVNKDADSVASKSVPVPSASGTSCHVESSVLVSKKVGDGLADSKLVECIGPSTVADKKSSVLSNLLTTEEFTKEPSLEYVMDKTEYSLDNSTWLDYLEPVFLSNDHDVASKANDIAVENESGQKEVVQDEISLHDGTESSRQVHSLCRVETEGSLGNSTWLDYLEPGSLSDNRDMGSKDNNLSVFEDSGRKDDVQNNIFLQNELPQKEETSTSGENLRGEGEMSSSAVGYEPDGLDFDGLGDLFNEPEIADMPNLKPSSSDTNIQANEIAETGFLVGNSSESDPDEVDNSDSPVSIESCLAFFIKPELLSNEHGWHCENCSKALQEQGMQSRRRQQRATSKIQTSEVQDRIQSAPSSSTKDCPCSGELGCLNNGDSRKHVLSTFDESLVSPNEKIDASQNYSNETNQKAELKEGNGEMNEALEELLQTSSCYKTCTQASISGEASDACSVNEPSNADCDTDEVQQRKSKLLPKGSDLEGNDSEKLNSDSMKVKRDATKRILINRVPPILTIHLKRFSQDARGRLSKLNGHVDFRDTIDLRPYMDPRCTGTDEYKFRLTGVVEHLGTMRGGHYVAYVRGAKGSRKAEQEDGDFVWCYASDDYVREASLEEVHRWQSL
ncbi:Ubiquitin carboxyl-terminal hydrolase like [Actinidia chinensis var. chinensis]|uniref:ubiquitinyl hydrolase 1 n=1 Tax=Actinidia chinensis var. chinensis TaxID=1590841 RepID=A0A2R6RXU6_ACTCC|nr:Ubiquitin carboxyl-terminal hydrolase like [Actinidia chinensis var. chinensis]